MKKIYFIGINGIGMSGLAKIMKIKGYHVSGGDISRSYVTEELENMDIKVYNHHNANNVVDMDTIIASSAIKKDNPEYKYAVENNIKIIKRGELLGELLNAEKGIAVAGTHGKTTTSSMLAAVMIGKDPTIVVGGILPEIGSNSRPGKSEYFIAEADESDNSFLHMKPSYSIITNIEADHLENHGSLENIKGSFEKFMNQTKEEIVIYKDCSALQELAKNRNNIKTYSLNDDTADIHTKNIYIQNGKTYYTVFIDGVKLGEIELSIPGEHNIANSLPVIYLANKFGVEFKEIKRALMEFKGAKRRYEILHLDENIKIIDDYAHHPTEIKATLQGAKSIEKEKIVAIFQPHRYSRVKFLLKEFRDVFKGADEVILLPVYSAGEENIYGVSLEDIKNISNHNKINIMKDENDIFRDIEKLKEKRVYLFMGAGDISKMAHKIKEKREKVMQNENI